MAGNSAPTGRELRHVAGTTAVNAHNLFGFGGNAGLSGVAAGPTDRVPGAALPGILSPLGSNCLFYTSPSPRDRTSSRMPSSA